MLQLNDGKIYNLDARMNRNIIMATYNEVPVVPEIHAGNISI